MIDSHCHLDFYADVERPLVAARAGAAGLAGLLTISTHLSRAASIVSVARALDAARSGGPAVWCTVGTHPCHVAEEAPPTLASLASHADDPSVVGLGESGLDHVVAPAGTAALQADSFRIHVAAARETGLPLIVHARGADDAVGAILREEHARGAFPFVMHCFSSGRALAALAVALGGYVSFSGILTFPKSAELREIARALPLDRLLVETDAPFLSPAPFRGQRNEPARVVHTAATLASVRGIDVDVLGAHTDANFARLFPRATFPRAPRP